MKRPLAVLAVFFCSLLLSQGVFGQFVPYSQYNNTPLLTNPAAPSLARYTEVEVHYRRSRAAHYELPSVSFLYPFRYKNGLSVGGLGMNVISQHAGPSGIYRVTGATAAFAYTIHLSKTHHIGAGISGGVHNKRIDLSGVTTDTQYNLGMYDPTLSHGEDFQSGAVTKPVINAGLYWIFTDLNNEEKASLAVAAYNMNRPTFTLLPDARRDDMTYIATGSIALRSRGRVTLAPTFRYIWQGTSVANIGARAIYSANADNKIIVGAWYKTSQALVFSAQYNSKSYFISASTDLTIAPDRDANVNNAVEIGVGWRMLRKEKTDPNKIMVRREKSPSRKQKSSSTNISRKERSTSYTKRDERDEKEAESLPKIEVIYFDSASAVVPMDRITFLEDLALALKNDPKRKLKISGHCGTNGDASIDKPIAQERARAVAKILLDNGVSESQLTIVDMGTRKPLGANRTRSGQQKNRRVELEWIELK